MWAKYGIGAEEADVITANLYSDLLVEILYMAAYG